MLKRLSTGATGDVYVARPVSGAADRHVAVKRLHAHLAKDRAAVTRFLESARLAAKLSHPNVVQVYDSGSGADGPWLAMELVEGVALSTLLEHARAANEVLPPPVLRLIAKNVGSALAYAHGQKVAHGDMSPANVLVSRDGVVRLTGFSDALDASADLAAAASMLPEPGAGELAPPHVLGAYVSRLCARELARFFALDSVPPEPVNVETSVTRGEGSVVARIGRAAEPAAPPRRTGRVALAAVGAALALGLLLNQYSGAATSVAKLARLEPPVDAGAPDVPDAGRARSTP
ncbi:MAG: protein kinase [Myxococcaceae bacterium]|nr:protein kinase [Myxococcaceae bacterium]